MTKPMAASGSVRLTITVFENATARPSPNSTSDNATVPNANLVSALWRRSTGNHVAGTTAPSAIHEQRHATA